MVFEKIQNDYKALAEQLSLAHSYLEEMIPEISKFLISYCKASIYDESFANKLDINLLYLEKIFEDLDEIMEYLEKINISEIKLPKIKEKGWEDLKIFTPKGYEQDIFVNNDFTIKWEQSNL